LCTSNVILTRRVRLRGSLDLRANSYPHWHRWDRPRGLTLANGTVARADVAPNRAYLHSKHRTRKSDVKTSYLRFRRLTTHERWWQDRNMLGLTKLRHRSYRQTFINFLPFHSMLSTLPPELLFHIVSFFPEPSVPYPDVPDHTLRSISSEQFWGYDAFVSLSQTCRDFRHLFLDKTRKLFECLNQEMSFGSRLILKMDWIASDASVRAMIRSVAVLIKTH
jgi:hypothetical protein